MTGQETTTEENYLLDQLIDINKTIDIFEGDRIPQDFTVDDASKILTRLSYLKKSVLAELRMLNQLP